MPIKVTNEMNPDVLVELQPIPTPKTVLNLPDLPPAPKEFRCSRCQGMRFHRAEHMGKLMYDPDDKRVNFVTTELSYRCVFCHAEYNEGDVKKQLA